MKVPILLRIKEIFNQNNFKSKKILNLNFTTSKTLFPEQELLDEKYIITNQRGNFTEILSSIESLNGKKFDLIFLQLALGIKTPDPNSIMLELIDKNLVENGVVLNLSTMNSFSIRLEKHFPNFTRFRENILGEVYKPETGISLSLYEYIKAPINESWMSGIYSSDFRNYSDGDNDLSNLEVIATPKAYFHSAGATIAQQREADKFKSKNLIPKYIRDVALEIHHVDLLPSNKKRNEVKTKIEKFENSVFLPVIPSKKNKAEIDVKNLVSTRYWLLTFNPQYILNEYVQNYLNSIVGKEQLMSLSVGAFIPSLNKEALSRICIPTKNTKEQEIVVKNRKKVAEAHRMFNEYIDKVSDRLEDEDFEFKPEELIKDFPDYTIRNLLSMEESIVFERKSTLRFCLKTNDIKNFITDKILRTIVAFLNTDGGTLIVGQGDDKEIIGIEADKFKNNDKCSLYLKDKIKDNIGIKYLGTYINYSFFKHEDKTLLVINCIKLPTKETAFLNETDYFKRTGPANEKLSTKQTLEYIELKKDIEINS